MALWQRDYRIALIDAEGVILSTSDLGRYAKLPLLVGLDAPKGAPALLEAFASRPDVASKITAAVRIGGRRWNIHLENGMDVRLPEHGLVSALDKVAKLLEDPRLAEKDLTAIDLRLPDRTVLQMSAAAASRRRDELKAAEDLKKKNAAQ
jgi:cell division protein FtsQ